MKSAMRNTPTAMARLRASSPSRRNGGTGSTIMRTMEMIPTGNAMLDSVGVSVLTSVAVLTANECCDVRASARGYLGPPSSAEPIDEGENLGDSRVEVDRNGASDSNTRCKGTSEGGAPDDIDPVLLRQRPDVQRDFVVTLGGDDRGPLARPIA